MVGAVRPGPLLAVAAGLLLAYSAIKGKKVTSALRDVINGQSPKNAASNFITGDASLANSSLVTGTDTTRTQSDVANAALAGQGHCYKYGGAPGTNGSGCWDCSSFVNYVIGVQLGGAIPGYGAGKYTGTGHGPPTGAWLIWAGVKGISRSAIQAGDLCVWQTHMGVAISNSEMVSALNPADGTRVTSIEGVAPPGEVLFPKRLR
jgi:peptidoglycan DL-endopeptidase CwlO